MDSLNVGIAAAVFSRVNEFMTDSNRATIARIRSGSAGGRTLERVGEVVFSREFVTALMALAENYGLDAVEKKTGIRLESLSEAGLARALGDRAGFTLNSLSDANVVKADLLRAVADRVETALGVSVPAGVDSVDGLMLASESFVRSKVEDYFTGLVLHNLFDAAVLSDDVMRFAAEKIKKDIGLSLSDVSSGDAIKADVLAWADVECRQLIQAAGGSDGGRLLMTKKAIHNRAAQRKFYRAHGDLHQTF